MGWDSNPRVTCATAGFQDRCLKPLGHPSLPLTSLRIDMALRGEEQTFLPRRRASANFCPSILWKPGGNEALVRRCAVMKWEKTGSTFVEMNATGNEPALIGAENLRCVIPGGRRSVPADRSTFSRTMWRAP